MFFAGTKNEKTMENRNTGKIMDKEVDDGKEKMLRPRGPRTRNQDANAKKFLRNFNPETSEREKRKLTRRFTQTTGRKQSLYNEKGILTQHNADLCDCLQLKCPGCHMTCQKCGSNKCAHECRNNRKWIYDSVDNEGSDIMAKNPFTN